MNRTEMIQIQRARQLAAAAASEVVDGKLYLGGASASAAALNYSRQTIENKDYVHGSEPMFTHILNCARECHGYYRKYKEFVKLNKTKTKTKTKHTMKKMKQDYNLKVVDQEKILTTSTTNNNINNEKLNEQRDECGSGDDDDGMTDTAMTKLRERHADVRFLHIAVWDSPDECIIDHFPQAFKFIDEAIAAGGRVLVHCAQGISRSATLLIGYLMTYNGKHRLDSTIQLVKQRRPIIRPNSGFMEQLRFYENQIHGLKQKQSSSTRCVICCDDDAEVCELACSHAFCPSCIYRHYMIEMEKQKMLDDADGSNSTPLNAFRSTCSTSTATSTIEESISDLRSIRCIAFECSTKIPQETISRCVKKLKGTESEGSQPDGIGWMLK